MKYSLKLIPWVIPDSLMKLVEEALALILSKLSIEKFGHMQ